MSRYRFFGVQAVALALAALLLAAPARAADADKLLPNDTETVVTINVKQVLTSPLAGKLPLDKAKEALKDQAEAQQVLTDLAFDPFTDLDSITLASSSGSETDKGLIIVHGKFDTAKFKAKAAEVAKDMEEVLKIHKVPGSETELYEVNAPNMPGNQALYVAVVSNTTLVASPGKDYVLDAIDKESGKKKSALKSKDLQALLARVDGGQSLWVAVLGSTLAKSPLAQNDECKQVIDKLADGSVGLTVEKDVKLQTSVTAKNADDAKDLEEKIKDGLNSALGFAALAATQNKELAPLVDLLKAVKPARKDKVVSVQFEVSGAMIEKALKKHRD